LTIGQAVAIGRKSEALGSGPAMPPTRPATAPPYFHVLSKPTGPICNLDCEYCFFLSKEALYPGDRFRMSEQHLDAYVRQVIESQTASNVTIAWQGGEPTLMGVGFFRRAIELAGRYRRPDQTLHHTIQTNGTLLTPEWCQLLRDHQFLAGISIDGPRELHDRYRVDKKGKPTFGKVTWGLCLLVEHEYRCWFLKCPGPRWPPGRR
jgi:serine-type anaerobic sulfatase-maturating enzyme